MKFAFTGFWILMFVTLGLAQPENKDKKNDTSFSGLWVLDKPKSDTGLGLKVQFNDVMLVVVQDEHEIKMTTKTKRNGENIIEEKIYYLDGREEDSSKGKDEDTKTSTKWNGKKLVILRKNVVRALTIGGSHQRWKQRKNGRSQRMAIR